MKKFLVTLPLIALAMVGATFADSTGTMGTGSTGTGWVHTGHISPEAKVEIHQNWETAKATNQVARWTFHVTYGYVDSYFALLTDPTAIKERHTTVKASFDTLSATRDQLRLDIKAGRKSGQPLSQDTIYARIDTMLDIWSASIVKYVDPAKTDSYNTFVANKKVLWKNIYGTNNSTYEKNQIIRQNDKNK